MISQLQTTGVLRKQLQSLMTTRAFSLVLVNNEAGEEAFEKVKEKPGLEADKTGG